jgi:preprotein translocase subunit YajC
MILDLLISPAYAQEAVSNNNISSFIPLILIFAIFYFLIIRPQSKKIKDHQKLISELKIGNKIITNSGIYGKIKSIDKNSDKIAIEIADNVIINIGRNYISDIEKEEAKDLKNKKIKNKNA